MQALALLLLSLPSPSAPGDPAVDPALRLAREYARLTFAERDLERAALLLAEEARFVDPTAEVWGGPAASGVQGREAILALQRSWRIEWSAFDARSEVVLGDHVVLAARTAWKSPGQGPIVDLPLAMVLRVEDGRIAERRDYGDYDTLFEGLQAGEAQLAHRAHRYLAALSERDFPALEEHLAEGARYVGHPAQHGAEPRRAEGRLSVLGELERSGAGPTRVGLDFAFASRRHAFFLGRRSGAVPGTAPFDEPFALVLTLDGQEVTEHREYGVAPATGG